MNTELIRTVILMRHGLRTPSADISACTSRRWFHSPLWRGQLTRRGRDLCFGMGQWMREELQEKGLPALNRENVKVSASQSARTVASAHAFSEGLTGERPPAADIETVDAGLFAPKLSGMNAAFQAQAEMQAAEAVHVPDIACVQKALLQEFALLQKILLPRENLDTAETKLILHNGQGPRLEGALQTAATLSDALICRHMLHPSFLKRIEDRDWQALSRICDTRRRILFGTDILVRNSLGALLTKLGEELSNGNSTCTLLCGHDSTVKAVMTALNILPCTFPGSVFGEIPPGFCLNMELYRGDRAHVFLRFRMVYPLDAQLLGRMPLNKSHPPGSQPLFLYGTPAAGGLYLLEDIVRLLTGQEGNFPGDCGSL